MRMLRFTLLLPLLLITLLGCNEQVEPPIRLGTNVWPGYEPLYLAQNLDLIDPSEIRLIEYSSTSDVIRAFRNNSLEAAALTLDEALLLKQDEVPITVILVTDISNGGDVILARKEIKSFTELKGKNVAVESAALGAFVISRALEIHGMSLADINVKHLDVSAHEIAYKNGWVDAVVTFEPVRTVLLNEGAHELFSSREIPGEIVDVLVVSNPILEQQPGRITALIDGWFGALKHLQQKPEHAAEIMARRQNITPAEVLASYQGLELPSRNANQQLLGSGGTLQNTIQRLSRSMRDSGLLTREISTATLLSDRFIK